MRTNSILFWILFGFFWAGSIAYTIWSIHDRGAVEWVGTVAMTLSGLLAAFIAFYLGRTQHAVGGTLPEDRDDANIDDGDPEIGHFSPWSWWPFSVACGLGLMFLGFAISPWLAFIGGPLVLVSVIGWNYEYYRNHFAR